MVEEEKHLCSCNCGGETKINSKGVYNKYINGHNTKGKKLGRERTEYEKLRNKIWHLNRKASEETKCKMKASAKRGVENPNYNQELHTLEKLEKHLCGCHCGGYTNPGRKYILGHNSKVNNPFSGQHHTEETKNGLKKKMPAIMRIIANKKEVKEKVKNARAKQVFPVKDTKIEVKIQNFLKELNIEFEKHKYIGEIQHKYCCDIYLPSLNLIIECDGDYWHGNIYKYPTLNDWQKKAIEIDFLKTNELIELGFKVLRLWEHEINVMSIIELDEKIKMVMKNG